MSISKKEYHKLYMREYRIKNREKILAQRKKWDRRYYSENKGKINSIRREKYRKNPEPYKERANIYSHSNPDKVKEYKIANRDKRNRQTKEWHERNKEHDKKYRKEYYKNNISKIRKYSKEYYAKNREIEIEKSRKWREENPEKVKLQQKLYARNNPHKIHAKGAKRRASLRNVKVENVNRVKVYGRDKGICGICGFKVKFSEMTLDHIIPLSKGGNHSYENIQLAHLSCNSSKGTKILNIA